jgi:hypothetical protein
MFVLLPLVASKLISLSPPTLDLTAQTASQFQIQLNKRPNESVQVFLEASGVSFSACQFQIEPTNHQVPINVTVYTEKGIQNSTPTEIPVKVRVCEGDAVYDQTYEIVRKPLPGGTCTSLGDPHYKTFDGQKMDFQGQGIYQFFSSSDLEIQTTQTACFGKSNGPSCNQAVAIRYGSTIVALDVRKSDRLVTVQGNMKSLKYSPPNKNDVTHSFAFPCGSKLIMIVHSMKSYKWIDVTLTLAPGYKSTGGVCNRLGNQGTSLYGSDRMYTISQVPAYFKSWIVADSNNLLEGKRQKSEESNSIGSVCALPKTTSMAYPPAITSTIVPSSSEPVYVDTTQRLTTATRTKMQTSTLSGTRLLTSIHEIPLPTTVSMPTGQTSETMSSVSNTETEVSTESKTRTTSSIGWSTSLVTTTEVESTHSEPTTTEVIQLETTSASVSAPGVVYTEAVHADVVQKPNVLDGVKVPVQVAVGGNAIDVVENSVVTKTEDPALSETQTLEPGPSSTALQVPPTFQREVEEHCNKIFPKECSTIVDREFYVESCVKDAVMMGSLAYSEPTRLQYMAQCKVKTEIMQNASDEHVQKEAETIQEVVGLGSYKCKNDCSGNGVCGENGCRCQKTFGGDDCSIDLTRLGSLDQETKEAQPNTPAAVYPEVGSIPANDQDIEELSHGHVVPKIEETGSIQASSSVLPQLPLSLMLLLFGI